MLLHTFVLEVTDAGWCGPEGTGFSMTGPSGHTSCPEETEALHSFASWTGKSLGCNLELWYLCSYFHPSSDFFHLCTVDF